MRRDRISRVLLVSCAWVALACGPGSDRGWGHGSELGTADELTATTASADGSGASVDKHTAPKKAYDLLSLLQERQGRPLPGYIGGWEFRNRERRLPQGHYREYDVNPKVRGRPRDAERIVIEYQTGKAFYTGDHYRTFIPLE